MLASYYLAETMNALLPTRVSIYHFLVIDTKPIASIVADAGGISIPQARAFVIYSIQAIVSGLLAFEQKQGSENVLKKLFKRSQVKELRHYNAFNFQTMNSAVQYGLPVFETLFSNPQVALAVNEQVASLSKISTNKTKPILAAMTLLCIRELAIVSDFAQLDAKDIQIWFEHQCQFILLPSLSSSQYVLEDVPDYQSLWHTLTGYNPNDIAICQPQLSQPHYAEVIGRNNRVSADLSNNLAHDTDNKNHAQNPNLSPLSFATIPNIYLPSHRWLLQLAKIMDIYLSRNRLKITSEPPEPPSRPSLIFSLQEKEPTVKTQYQPIEYADKTPFWKMPLFIIMVVVLGGLGTLAVLKYNYTDTPDIDDIIVDNLPNDPHPKDIAIIRVAEEEATH